MEILAVAVDVIHNAQQAAKLWPVEAGVAFGHDFLDGPKGVATVVVDQRLAQPPKAGEEHLMRSAVLRELDAQGKDIDSNAIVYAGPTSRIIASIALQLADVQQADPFRPAWPR